MTESTITQAMLQHESKAIIRMFSIEELFKEPFLLKLNHFQSCFTCLKIDVSRTKRKINDGYGGIGIDGYEAMILFENTLLPWMPGCRFLATDKATGEKVNVVGVDLVKKNLLLDVQTYRDMVKPMINYTDFRRFDLSYNNATVIRDAFENLKEIFI